MAKRKVLKYGDERLRKVAKPVTEFDEDLFELLDDMRDTMYANNGMGLAATQVGVLKRVVIMDLGGSFYELINPIIVSSEGEQEEEEGCLSVPNFSDIWLSVADTSSKIASFFMQNFYIFAGITIVFSILSFVLLITDKQSKHTARLVVSGIIIAILLIFIVVALVGVGK